jgi:hypothetical protein
MDPLNWKRALALGIIGVAIGFGAAALVEATDWHPLVAPLLCAAGAAAVAFALRKCEVLNCLVESAIFTYGTFLGLSFVRTGHNYLERYFPSMPQTPTALLHELNLVVLWVGLPYTFAVVLLVCLPVWALAQMSKEAPTERDERFWQFLDDQTRR